MRKMKSLVMAALMLRVFFTHGGKAQTGILAGNDFAGGNHNLIVRKDDGALELVDLFDVTRTRWEREEIMLSHGVEP